MSGANGTMELCSIRSRSLGHSNRGMTRCARVTAKKYVKRPSPPFHAGDCKGEIRKGNDGKEYMSVADRRGVHTWKQATTRKVAGKRYEIHDNGGRPFVVGVKGNTLTIYKTANNSPQLLKSFTAKKIWLENDALKVGPYPDIRAKGHAILAQLSANKFLFIGAQIFTFELEDGDSPVAFESYVGNSDVPYSYLVGKTHTYFLTEPKDVGVVANAWLDLKRDAYGQFYGHAKGPVKSHIVRRRLNLIHKRIL
jgi:hypothetical protein